MGQSYLCKAVPRAVLRPAPSTAIVNASPPSHSIRWYETIRTSFFALIAFFAARVGDHIENLDYVADDDTGIKSGPVPSTDNSVCSG